MENKYYETIAFIDGEPVYENFSFDIIENGTQLEFYETPSSTPTINYTEAVTLEPRTDVTLNTTNDDKIFEIPNGEAIRGYYDILQTIDWTITEK